MARWSEETTLKFVEEYIKQECLWDARLDCYKNRELRNNAYTQIQNAMNIEGFERKEVIQKIKNIRSTYSQEMKKIKVSKKSGAGTEVYTPHVKWFSLLYGKLQRVKEAFRTNQTSFEQNTQQDNSQANSQSSEQVASSSSNNHPPKKKKKIEELTSVIHQIQELQAQVNTEPNERNENEFDVFGRHIAVQLKALPLLSALQAQQHIQTYLTQFRIQQYYQLGNTSRAQSPQIHHLTPQVQLDDISRPQSQQSKAGELEYSPDIDNSESYENDLYS